MNADRKRRYELLHAMQVVAEQYSERYNVSGFLHVHLTIRQDTESFLSVSVDDPRKVAYSPKGVAYDDHKQRRRTTLARYLNRQCADLVRSIPESYLNKYCQDVVAMIAEPEAFIRIVEGKEILDAYRKAYGSTSCMTGCDSQEYVNLFAESGNKGKVRMILFDDKRRMKARALVWQTNEGDTIVDRVYPNNGWHIPVIAKYAKTQGWVMRSHHHLPDGPVPFDSGKTYTVNLVSQEGLWPYLDSFHWATGDEFSATLYTSPQAIPEGERYGTMSSCSGDFPRLCNMSGSSCYNCGEVYDESELIPNGDVLYCHECMGRDHTYSEIDDSWVYDADVVYTCDSNEPVHADSDNVYRCHGCGSPYASRNALVRVTSGDPNVMDLLFCDECYSENFVECSVCGYTINAGDELEDREGNPVCSDCHATIVNS